MPKKEPVKKFSITRVVTRNVVTDSFQWIRNIFGLRLRGYETIIQRTIDEITSEAELKYHVSWYRIIVNPLTNGSAMIIIYGEGEEYE